MKNSIFLDNNSTTPVDPRVIDAMMPYLTGTFANPSSTHRFGLRVERDIQIAKTTIGAFLNCSPEDLIFTSGATESINLALKGFALSNQRKGSHIITVETEHKACLDTLHYLESIGFEVTYLKVSSDGLINLNDLKKSIRKDTILISVMWVNNEIGIIQPIDEISEICKENDIIFFSDATQAIGKLPINLSETSVGLLAFSAHKFYGPKGVGCLFIRDLKRNKNSLTPILHGGGHQYGLRSGTYNTPGIIALAECCNIAHQEIKQDALRIGHLRDELQNKLISIPGTVVNAESTSRLYNILNIRFEGIDANILIDQLDNISVSNGSACTAAIVEPSHVLSAIGLSNKEALASIRISLGRFNTIEEIDIAANSLKTLINKVIPQNA